MEKLDAPAQERNAPDATKFNGDAKLPYQLRIKDFELVMQDVYDFFADITCQA